MQRSNNSPIRLSRVIPVILLALSCAGAVVAVPLLTIPETEFDFGFVPQNVRVSHVFWLYSTGTDTVKILQVNPG